MLSHHWILAEAGVGRQASPAGEGLQADVMRFLAILGFCLMAIFALVQSIPASPPPPTATDPAPMKPGSGSDTAAEQLHEEASTLARQVQAARQLRDSTLEEARAQRQAVDHAAQALAEVRESYRRQFTQLANLRQSIDVKQRRLKRLTSEPEGTAHRAIGSQPAESERTEPPDSQRPHEPEKPPTPPKPPERAPSQPRSRTTTVVSAAAIQPGTVRSATNAASPSPAPSRGYVLRFASDDALRALVEAGVVSLYAIDEVNVWRVRVAAGAPHLVAAPRPRSLHIMVPGTVPEELLAAYGHHNNRSPNPEPTWGVLLPEPIRRQLTDFTRAGTGGTLTIDDGGRVHLDSRSGAH